MKQVWFSDDGSTLYARTASDRVFATTDFEAWRFVTDPPKPPVEQVAVPVRSPEPGARLVAASPNTNQVFALGRHLSRSDDGGRSWINLTAYKSQSVVGFGQRSVAVSRFNPDQVVVANDFGVWRSMDGGLSWTGLNLTLPNLSVQRILSTPPGTSGLRVAVKDVGALQLQPSTSIWEQAATLKLEEEAQQNQKYSKQLQADIVTVAVAGDTLLAGSSDGRIWWSQDAGKTFTASMMPSGMEPKAGNNIERIWVDASKPLTALAAVSGAGPHVLLTSSRGLTWDALDSPTLPNVPAWSVAADHSTGAVYVATDKGVFYTHANLEYSVNPQLTWQNITPDPMPAVRATDVRLDSTGVQLYIAMDGYGVYRAPAPHRTDGLRIVNSADLSNRAAAPGSLLSVIGTPVSSVRGANLDYPVLAVLDNASQIQVPFEAVGPTVSLILQTPTGPQERGISVLAVSPAILTGNDGIPVLADSDSGLAIDARNAAHSNSRIQIMATGLGKVRPDWQAGVPAPADNPPEVVANVRAFLDGKPLQVTRATLAPQYVGIYVIEVQLPPITNAGASVLHISADGQESNRVLIVIEP